MKSVFLSIILSLSLASAQEPVRLELSGRVVDRANRLGIPGAHVFIEEAGARTFTSSDGSFQFRELLPQSYHVATRIPGYVRDRQEITLRQGEHVSVSIELDADVYPTDPVVVTATRDASRITDVPASIDVVPATQLERSLDLEEAIELLPGVLTRSYGTIGDIKSVSIRGSSAGQVLILVDGRRVNNAQLGEVDLSAVPLGAVERVEVVRGSASALYGADAVGGVVNIITAGAPPDSATRMSLTATGGSFGTRGVEASAAGMIGGLSSLLSYRYMTSLGNFEYLAPDGVERPRMNASMIGRNIFGKLGWSDGGATAQRASIVGEYYSSDAGSPGTIDQPSTNSRKENRTGSLTLSYDRRLGSPFATARAQLYYSSAIFNYNDPLAYVPVRSASHNSALGGEAQAKAPLADWNVLTAGYAFRMDRMTGSSLGKGRSRQLHSLYGQMEIALPFAAEPWLRHVVFTPAVRWDRFSDFGGEISPRLGMVVTAGEEWQLSLKAAYGRSFRAPTFNDLYWPKDNFAEGNPLLTPEHGVDREVAMLVRAPFLGLGADVTWFHTSLSDMILWQSGGGGMWTPKNIGKAELRGMELRLAAVPVAEHLFLDWNYTLLDARNRTERANELDMQLAYRARHVHHMTARIEAFGARAMATMQYAGKRFTTPSNTTSLPPYRVTDILLGYRLALGTADADLSFEAMNIGDIRYQAIEGYPMPGREFRVSLKIVYDSHNFNH